MKKTALAIVAHPDDAEFLFSGTLALLYDKPSILRVLAHVRKIRPQLVLTMSPTDYMLDHEITGTLVQSACFHAWIYSRASAR